jgi:hypothetical protein
MPVLYSCWCCHKLRANGYQKCLLKDRSEDTKTLLSQLLKDVKSPRQFDTVEIKDVRDKSGNDTATSCQ